MFVQGNVLPVTVPLKVIALVVAPLQMVILAGVVTVGVGLTVMVNVFVGPVQNVVPVSKYRGVTVIVATIAAVVVLVVVNELISPVPLAGSPIPV